MIKIENTDVYGFEPAIRGARNPLDSHNRMDTVFGLGEDFYTDMVIGPNDLSLLTRLANAGPDHRKFMRMITVTMDVTAPFYWWKEYDTYKIATVANSYSTMHKIHAKEFELSDFSHEHLDAEGRDLLKKVVDYLNSRRKLFNETKSKDYWWHMIQILGTSFNQKRTLHLNYEVLRNMYHARKAHKLDEWHVFCDWIETLPYAKELIVGEVAE